MADIGVVSYATGAGLFLVLTLLLLSAWRGRMRGALLVAACAVSTLWCATLAFHAAYRAPAFEVLQALEITRNALWLVFLLSILGYGRESEGRGGFRLRLVGHIAIGLCAGSVVLLLIRPYLGGWIGALGREQELFFVHLLLAVAGLVLVEQLYRNTRSEHRWAIKFLCLGVGALFAYDFYLYSHALLFKSIGLDLWNARGVVNALVVPLIAVSVARNPQWSVEIFVSRQIVFHSAAVLGAGVYLILMAAAGYYIRLYGGTWGGVVQVAFLFGAVVLLLMLLSSGQLRSRAKVFLSKHFFRNRYDYREEWLRFTHALSRSHDDAELRENMVRAVAEIVESPGGAMWIQREGGRLRPIASWNTALPEGAVVKADDALVRFLERTGWVVYLDELREAPERYDGLELPAAIARLRAPWIIVPLPLRGELLGFIVVQRSNTKKKLNWEDTDLLKTVGREAASYLAVFKLSEALADARQFEAFNRLSAYVVHDLKNMVAQLSLVVRNAKRHGGNTEFLRDAIHTVENATARMTRLLEHLRKGRPETTTDTEVELEAVLRQVVHARSATPPTPSLECVTQGLSVRADPDRLGAVIEHIVQNAQEATATDGRVAIRLRREGNWALIEVEDNGSGMDAQFISERLFRPFDTTKGNAGMGIGVYESREYVREHGGDVAVESTPGRGTRFAIRLPLAGVAASAAAAESEAGVAS